MFVLFYSSPGFSTVCQINCNGDAATTIATTNNTTYDQVPPAYIPDSGYQPYPAGAPSPAEDPNH